MNSITFYKHETFLYNENNEKKKTCYFVYFGNKIKIVFVCLKRAVVKQQEEEEGKLYFFQLDFVYWVLATSVQIFR